MAQTSGEKTQMLLAHSPKGRFTHTLTKRWLQLEGRCQAYHKIHTAQQKVESKDQLSTAPWCMTWKQPQRWDRCLLWHGPQQHYHRVHWEIANRITLASRVCIRSGDTMYTIWISGCTYCVALCSLSSNRHGATLYRARTWGTLQGGPRTSVNFEPCSIHHAACKNVYLQLLDKFQCALICGTVIPSSRTTTPSVSKNQSL